MRLQMSPRQSRLLAVLLLLLAIAVVVAVIAVPTLMLHRHYDKYLDEYSDHLARYRRVAAMRPDIERTMAEVEKRDARRFYLKAHSQTMAAAELQGVVARIIESQKGRMITSQVMQTKDDGKTAPATRVALSVQFNAAIVPLQTILHDVEVHEPYLFIDQLTVRANQGRAFKPVPGVQPEFVVQMTVSAYMQIGEEAK